MAKIINGSSLALALANYLCTNAYLNDTAQNVLIMVGNWIDEAPEITVPLWIPVSERLPEKGETVIALGSRGGVYVAQYKGSRYWHKLNARCHMCEPTHWMPLPEPPKEE